ncbi:peptidase S8/S53 domain-containing protein [Limtongia smithiae]|uniref:peptidase S8/S53 domain-containing protein n=1 Tax=Limtongia smithiae TaxID=1125753 RepID=UPI0034CE70ED
MTSRHLLVAVCMLLFAVHCVNATYLIQLSAGMDISTYLEEHPYIKSNIVRTYSFGEFRAIAAELDTMFATVLDYEAEVENVSPDIVLRANEVVNQTGSSRHLARISQHEALGTLDALVYSYDSSAGTGVDAYVLDTGVYKDHPDFGGRVTDGADFSGEGFQDDNGHGTHVGGLIGSATYGVAKNISIVNVKVLGATGGGSLSSVIAGLDYAANQRTVTGRRSVANLSLGAAYNAILNNAVKAAVDSGLAVVVAAGNDGLPACAYSPASSREALTVGALDDADDSIAPFSNWGHCVNVFTSGVSVISLLNSGNGTVSHSGTSMASPITAGLVGYFMGLGDNETEAVERVKNIATYGQISWFQILFRPFTPNKIGFNNYGLPLNSTSFTSKRR